MSTSRYARLARLTIGASLFAGASLEAQQQAGCPRHALTRLGHLPGQWSVSWRTRVDDSLVTATGGRSTIAWAAGRCALSEEFSARLQNGPSAQHRLFAVAGDSLAMIYLDSEHGEPLTFVETRGAPSGNLRLTWRRRMPNGRGLRVRYTWQQGADTNHFQTTTELSTDDGASWRLVQDARYVRVAPPPA